MRTYKTNVNELTGENRTEANTITTTHMKPRNLTDNAVSGDALAIYKTGKEVGALGLAYKIMADRILTRQRHA